MNLCSECSARVARTVGQRVEICIGCIGRARAGYLNQLRREELITPLRSEMPPAAGLARRIVIRCARGWRSMLRALALFVVALGCHYLIFVASWHWWRAFEWACLLALADVMLDKAYGKKL